jgi:cell wall-associated NlpC family hydrolase
LLKAAYRSLGITYRWGGNTPKEGFDCSGLTKFTHKNVHVSIPRTALEQSKASRTISRQQLKPGDMIFFRTSGKTVNHVGIYVGNGKFIHAASGGGKVTLDDLRRAYWQQRLVKYGTFLA